MTSSDKKSNSDKKYKIDSILLLIVGILGITVWFSRWNHNSDYVSKEKWFHVLVLIIFIITTSRAIIKLTL